MDLTDLFQPAENRRGGMANFSGITSFAKEKERRKDIIRANCVILYLYIVRKRRLYFRIINWTIILRSW
jgi:hypothetical protein